MTEASVSGHSRIWPLGIAEPLPPPGPLVLYACNTVIESSNRNVFSSWVSTGGLTAGTLWRYTASNPVHDPIAIMQPQYPAGGLDQLFGWRLFAGPAGPGTPSTGAGAEVMVNLSFFAPSQAAAPFTAYPTRSGYFTVPEHLTIADAFGFVGVPDYAPGIVGVNECLSIVLECLDCEEQEALGAGALLRGHASFELPGGV